MASGERDDEGSHSAIFALGGLLADLRTLFEAGLEELEGVFGRLKLRADFRLRTHEAGGVETLLERYRVQVDFRSEATAGRRLDVGA